MDLSCVLLPFVPLHQSSAQIIKAIREIQEIDGMMTATHVGKSEREGAQNIHTFFRRFFCPGKKWPGGPKFLDFSYIITNSS